MKRIRITIAYDGTAYCGFQLQQGCPTVEGELNRALSLLTGEEIRIIGASRTDSGVHASGNVAVFDTFSSIPADRYQYAALPYLPADIRITGGVEVTADWHPRKQSARKTYTYSIYCGSVEDPLIRLYAAYSRYDLDVAWMREAAGYLIGEYDFTSFANPRSQVLMEGGSPVREIYAIDINKNFVYSCKRPQGAPAVGGTTFHCCGSYSLSAGESAGDDGDEKACVCEVKRESSGYFRPSLVTITVTGNGFLYNMVRIIAGSLISVGSGLWKPERVKEALLARDRRAAGPTAEARGLRLDGIEYEETRTTAVGKNGTISE